MQKDHVVQLFTFDIDNIVDRKKINIKKLLNDYIISEIINRFSKFYFMICINYFMFYYILFEKRGKRNFKGTVITGK